MTVINTSAYILSILFIAFLAKNITLKMLKNAWHNAATSVQHKRLKAKSEKEGKKPFYYEGGNVVIYAHSKPKADYDYRMLKQDHKAVKKQLKKV